jgi:CRP-like cAMP-binding protein
MQIAMSFFRYLNKFIPLTEQDFNQQLFPYIELRRFGKKQIVTQLGDVENYLNFVITGLVRKYYVNEDHEVNTQISHEGHIIHAQESFHSRQPSEYFVETIEPSLFISISYEDLEAIYARDVRLERLGRMVITFTMVQKDRWQMQMIKQSPRERFLNFVERHPDLLRRVPQKHLASFLNIQPETFSRFKHLVKLNKREKPV